MLLNNQLITCVRRNPQINRQKIISNLEPLPLTGLDIGIPLNIIENVFTNIH